MLNNSFFYMSASKTDIGIPSWLEVENHIVLLKENKPEIVNAIYFSFVAPNRMYTFKLVFLTSLNTALR